MKTDTLHPAAREALAWLDARMTRFPEGWQDMTAAGVPHYVVVCDFEAQRLEMVSQGLVVGITRDIWDRRRELLGGGDE